MPSPERMRIITIMAMKKNEPVRLERTLSDHEPEEVKP